MTESRAWQDSESGVDPSSTGIESVISDEIRTGVDAPAQTSADNRESQSPKAEGKIESTSLTRAHVNVDELTKRDHVVRSASTSKEVPPEIRILGDYELLREISHGGQGVVYEARKRTLDLPVAVKVLHFSGMLSTAMLQRFRLEARAASQLRHPNILRVHDIGFDRGTHFYAMDYVEGGTVSDMIRNLARQRKQLADASTKVSRSSSASASVAKQATTVNGSSSFNVSSLSDHRQYYRFVAKLGFQVADALNFSHQHGVVHRDIKPSNLLLDTSGCVYVSDFGLARFDGQQELTKPGEFLGTLRYMSPEQGYANRVTLDGRTDIFSLGATLYEMLTLQPAFQGESKAEILHNVAFRDLTQAKQIDRGIPSDLNTIVMKCLEKKPDDRYQDARQLRDDLESWLDHRRVIATPPTTAKRVSRWIMKHRGISGTIGLCVLTAITMGFSALAFALQAEKEQVGRYAKLLRQSESMRLAANSALQLPQNPGLAVALAAKGVDVQRSLEAESALRAALDENHERLVLRDHSGAVGQASFSPHGKFIVTTGASIDFSRSKQPARLYDAASGKLIRTLQADDLITSAAFEPHGDRLLTASTPNNANARMAEDLAKHPPVLWNVEHGNQIGVLRDAYLLKAHPACFSIVSGVTQIVAPSLNNAACIYNAAGEKIRTLEGHQASVTFAAFNPQGDKVVTVAEDNTVRIWNSSTGEQLKVLDYWKQFAPSDFHRYIKQAEFSSDGASLLVTSHLGVQLWDWQAQTFRELGNGSFAAFSPDGHYIGIQFADYVRIVDAVNLQELRKVVNDKNWIVQMEFSQDGQHLLTCDGSGQVLVWMVADGKQVARLHGHSGNVQQASFSPNGLQVVSASHDATARVWHIESGAARSRLPAGFDSKTVRIAVHPTQRQAVLNTSAEERISGWDVKQGSLRFAIPGQLLDVDTSSKYFASRNAGRIAVHSCDDGAELRSFTLPANMRSQANFSFDGQQLLIFGSRSHCWLWNWNSNQTIKIASGDEIWDTAFHPKRAEFVIGGAKGKVRLLNLATGAEIAAFEHDFGMKSLTYSADGTRILALSDQDQARVLKADTLELVCEISREGMNIDSVRFSPDHKFVLTARLFETGVLAAWDSETGRLVTSIDAPSGLNDLTVAGERQAFVCSNLTGAYWWDFAEGTLKQIKAGRFSLAKPISGGAIVTASAHPRQSASLKINTDELEFHTPQLQVLTPSATAWDSRSFVDVPGEVWRAYTALDQSRLILGERFHSASLYDLETRQSLGRFTGHAAPLSCVEFSADGRTVITAALDGQILIHDAETRKLIKRLNHPSAVVAAAMSQDGFKLATVGRGGSVIVWNLQDYQAMHLEGLTETVDSCSFSAYGARLVARANDGSWRVWDTQTGRQMHPQLTQQSVVAVQYEREGTRILIARRTAPFVTLLDENGSQRDLPLDEKPNHVAFGKRDQVVIVTKDEVALWNATTAKKDQSFREAGAEFVSALPDADGTQWLTCQASGQLALWHRDGTKMQVIDTRFSSRLGSPIAFSHDNKWLVIPDDASSIRSIAIDARSEADRDLIEEESNRFKVLLTD